MYQFSDPYFVKQVTEGLAVPMESLKFFSEQQVSRWLGVVNWTADVTFKALRF